MTTKLKKSWLFYPRSIKKAKICTISKVSQAAMHKWNKVVILSNDSNVVVLILHYVEKFVRESYKIFGLDMAHKIDLDIF